jgi:hypothetical protein
LKVGGVERWQEGVTGDMRALPPAKFRGEPLVEGWGKAPIKFKKFTMPHVHSGSFSDEKHET